MSKRAAAVVIIICSMIIISGFTIVSVGLPKYVKDQSNFKMDYTSSPFDFTVDAGNYSLSLNNKVGENFKNGSEKIMNVVGSKIYSGTSYIIDVTRNVFQNVEDRFTK
ncbi:hypothetical protein [Clostridium luticellarii]|jgi:hypothetical protein|uniref:Uncharacterized protein n=1 Tax=Clostridium luticellarii TaxID=1691940 RepID=A0A2T0BM13_9CLOT|nr:hypothetical protein [Clostridium luticellarii]MCI1944118.1 hypothetical protein [Clostridium luticellarii]MCI1967240.1 hypothetical protein [Clostridium luticellarii]MCI1995151.1 hypothetical protein [Clostridium luticellarii]MCI2039353.1 hypothetical protein [Clostridium luticellarii]PRR84921.1 hypothetical protein CLLU_21150 [Clostridium luticellarii]